jgi:hypothetical protein
MPPQFELVQRQAISEHNFRLSASHQQPTGRLGVVPQEVKRGRPLRVDPRVCRPLPPRLSAQPRRCRALRQRTPRLPICRPSSSWIAHARFLSSRPTPWQGAGLPTHPLTHRRMQLGPVRLPHIIMLELAKDVVDPWSAAESCRTANNATGTRCAVNVELRLSLTEWRLSPPAGRS